MVHVSLVVTVESSSSSVATSTSVPSSLTLLAFFTSSLEVVRALGVVVLATRLVEQLVLILKVVMLHLLFQLLLDIAFQPVFGALSFISFVNHVLMLVFNVLQYEIFTLEDLLADFTTIPLVRENLLALVLKVVFNV